MNRRIVIGLAGVGVGAWLVYAGAGEWRAATWALPDPALTPGAVWSTDPEEVCRRPLPPRPSRGEWMLDKYNRMQMYGLRWRDRNRYQLDHLVPRELGGADALANLWPEPWPQARLKDQIEDAQARDFCENDRSAEGLEALQRWFERGEWAR